MLHGRRHEQGKGCLEGGNDCMFGLGRKNIMGDTEHGTWGSVELGAYIERDKARKVYRKCKKCGATTRFYEQSDLCLRCEICRSCGWALSDCICLGDGPKSIIRMR